MSAIPQGNASWGTALYVPPTKGIYVGPVPGNVGASTIATGTPLGPVADLAGVTIAVGGAVSTLSSQPQNVLRITGAGGVGFIQGSNIAFSMPYSGAAGIRILPSTNAINVNNLNFVSTINAIGVGGTGVAGAINMTELTSSIKGYGWASVMPAGP